jgi:hypothetical protein
LSALASLVVLGLVVACHAASESATHVTLEDAAMEASPGADDAGVDASTFCTTLSEKPTFCADFDGERPFAGWINEQKTPDPGTFGGGTIIAFDTLDPAHGKVARFTIPALLDGTARAAAFLDTQLAGPPKTFGISFAVRVERDVPAAGSGAAKLLMVSYGTALGYIGVERSATKTELFVAERVLGTLKGRYAPLDHLAIAKGWSTLSLQIQNVPLVPGDGGMEGEVSATLGSSTVKLALPPAFRNKVGEMSISIGVPNAQGPLDGFQIDFDAVQIVVRD